MNPLTRRGRALLTSLSVAVAALTLAEPTSAICLRRQGDPMFDTSNPDLVVFVGTAAEVGINHQNALFQVDEVWHGSPVPVWQAVFSQADGRAILSTSPSFEQGVTYLVVAQRHFLALVSVGCAATQPYTDQVRALRPLEPSAPTAAERPGSWEPNLYAGPPWPLFMGGFALLAGVFLVRRSLLRRQPEGSAS